MKKTIYLSVVALILGAADIEKTEGTASVKQDVQKDSGVQELHAVTDEEFVLLQLGYRKFYNHLEKLQLQREALKQQQNLLKWQIGRQTGEKQKELQQKLEKMEDRIKELQAMIHNSEDSLNRIIHPILKSAAKGERITKNNWQRILRMYRTPLTREQYKELYKIRETKASFQMLGLYFIQKFLYEDCQLLQDFGEYIIAEYQKYQATLPSSEQPPSEKTFFVTDENFNLLRAQLVKLGQQLSDPKIAEDEKQKIEPRYNEYHSMLESIVKGEEIKQEELDTMLKNGPTLNFFDKLKPPFTQEQYRKLYEMQNIGNDSFKVLGSCFIERCLYDNRRNIEEFAADVITKCNEYKNPQATQPKPSEGKTVEEPA